PQTIVDTDDDHIRGGGQIRPVEIVRRPSDQPPAMNPNQYGTTPRIRTRCEHVEEKTILSRCPRPHGTQELRTKRITLDSTVRMTRCIGDAVPAGGLFGCTKPQRTCRRRGVTKPEKNLNTPRAHALD